MAKEIPTYPIGQRPDVEVFVDGTWYPGELREWIDSGPTPNGRHPLGYGKGNGGMRPVQVWAMSGRAAFRERRPRPSSPWFSRSTAGARCRRRRGAGRDAPILGDCTPERSVYLAPGTRHVTASRPGAGGSVRLYGCGVS
jgi:hypothetical protein